MAVKQILQVFDWLKMSHPIGEQFQDWAETNNDSYVRWYPDDSWDYPPKELKEAVNNWLLENGMEVDPNNKYFHVLIHVSW